jgi:hypothetical protein
MVVYGPGIIALVTISFRLHSELDVLMDTVKAVEEVSKLAWYMCPDDELVAHIAETADWLVSCRLQSSSLKVLHEEGSTDWGAVNPSPHRRFAIRTDR